MSNLGWRGMDYFFGTDFADCTDLGLIVVAVRIQAPEFLLHTILRRGVNFAFYVDSFTVMPAYFNVY